MNQPHGAYLISDEATRLDPVAIHAYLTRAYWCEGIPFDVVERSLRGSLCIGVYESDGGQVGLVRIITDSATYAYLCDVYVLEAHRSHGLAKAMMTLTMNHPQLQGLRRWNLVTRDAHGLYAQFGFVSPAKPHNYMERLTPAADTRR